MASVVLGRAPGVAPNGLGGVGLGAAGGAHRSRLCWGGRRGWRPMVPVARGLAPGVAPNGVGGVGVGAGVGAQRRRWRGAGRQG